MERVADFVDVGAVNADGFVENLAGDVELFGPVSDVAGDLGVDLFRVAGALGVVLVRGVRLVGFGCVVVLGHAEIPLFGWFWFVGCCRRVYRGALGQIASGLFPLTCVVRHILRGGGGLPFP
jgi:hypothetical protein